MKITKYINCCELHKKSATSKLQILLTKENANAYRQNLRMVNWNYKIKQNQCLE